MSIVEYINAKRLTESCQLLKASDRSITEIAHMVGFRSSSYFNLKFRELFNCTPMDYRKNTSIG